MKNQLSAFASAVVLACILASCGNSGHGGKYGPDAEGLNALFTDLQAAIRANDVGTAAELTRGLLPLDASIKRAFRDGAGEAVEKVSELYSPSSTVTNAQFASMFKTDLGRTEIQVHGSTTEELAAYKQGTVAYSEFPGGANMVADLLRPGTRFYEVELLEPGEDRGMKYHLFFHDGNQWKQLGAVWRVLR